MTNDSVATMATMGLLYWIICRTFVIKTKKMKKVLLFLMVLCSTVVFGQKTQDVQIAKSVQVTPQIIQGTFPLHLVMKTDSIPNINLDDVTPLQPTSRYRSAQPPSTWLTVVQCIIDAEGITCEDLGCAQLDTVMAGTWKVVAEVGQRAGGWAYWVQGQPEPLLNYHNGVFQLGVGNGQVVTVQIWQQILSPRRLQIDDELILAIK